MTLQRRLVVKAVAAALALAGAGLAVPAQAQPKEVRVALIAPMSGPWARQGELMKKGADMAIEDINRSGGVKALGGAKMSLFVIDAGDSVEKAKNAAQRLVAQETDIVGATGAWLSSFTLAVTEVTERAELPVLTHSFADQITSRGFRYVFQTSPTGGMLSTGALPAILDLAKRTTGKPVKTVGIIMDNTASSVSFTKPLREGGLEKMGLKLVFDEIFTPPLSDATPMVQKIRNTRPDFVLLLQSNAPDSKLLLEKMNEMGLGKGRVPVAGIGAGMAVPELLQLVGKDLRKG
jgi:branched-chain amino acid transport system substrate-binding protein